jgi:hypothetical protein
MPAGGQFNKKLVRRVLRTYPLKFLPNVGRFILASAAGIVIDNECYRIEHARAF